MPVVLTVAEALGVSHTVGQNAVALDTDGRGVDVAWSETSNADDFSLGVIARAWRKRFRHELCSSRGAIVKGDLTA